MRGSEVNINLSEMKEWTSALKSSDTMKIIALENGDIAMGAELRKSMSEKMADAWKIKLYATDDMKILAVHPDINSDFRYPKNGRRKFKSYVESLKNKGYKIPATYNVEWNEKIQSWVCLFFRKLKYWKNADIICGRLERKNRFLSVIHQWIKRRWK